MLSQLHGPLAAPSGARNEAACVKGSTAGRQHGSMPICACSGPSWSGSASSFTAAVRLEGKRSLDCTNTFSSLHKGVVNGLLSGRSLLLK